MSDELQAPEVLKISATFSRSVSDGNYGSIKAEAWVQGDISATAAPAEVTEKATLLLQTASVAVWDQLGLDYKLDEVTGLLKEDLPDPKVQVERTVGGGGGSTNNGGSVRVMNPNDQQGELPDWLISAASSAGVTAVFDNRKTATGNQPLFKEAVARGGRGHGKDGEAKAFWAPK
jgi:hypothetical protein